MIETQRPKKFVITPWMIWLAVMGLILLSGVIAGLIVFWKGLGITNLTDKVPWALWITIDLSSIALGAGAFSMCAAVYLFGLKLGWLPLQGYTSPFDDFGKSLKQVVMPVICLAVPFLAILTRQTRSSMLEIIKNDYIRTAMSKGLKERVIISRHAFRNALIPIVTLIGINLRTIIGGSVLVETVFNIPGMGRLLVQSCFNKDFQVMQASLVIMSLITCISNLAVDISYGWIDPRVRYE